MRKDSIIKKICSMHELGSIISYEKENSSQNDVYKGVTDKDTYIIKEFSKDAIGNYYHLNKRKKQIEISEKLKKHGIQTITPLKLKGNYFFLFNHKYYLIYNYKESKIMEVNNLMPKHISSLAKIQANIHKLKLKTKLPCTYRKVNIDFDKYLLKYKNDSKVYEVLLKNKEKLEDLISCCNSNITEMKNKLCISHNDYKPKNILWSQDRPILIDFDAMGLVNHACALSESAFTFSNLETNINYDYYKLYLKEYISVYGSFKEDYKKALYVSMNGKIRWYMYLLSKNDKEGIISMTNELALFYDNIDKFYSIYENVNNK